MLTYGIPPEFRGGVHLFIYNRHTPSGQSRVYRVTQLRTDGVHCRESAGTGPVNLKVVPNECCLAWQVTMDQLIFASLSHTHYWYKVGMLKVCVEQFNDRRGRGCAKNLPYFKLGVIKRVPSGDIFLRTPAGMSLVWGNLVHPLWRY